MFLFLGSRLLLSSVVLLFLLLLSCLKILTLRFDGGDASLHAAHNGPMPNTVEVALAKWERFVDTVS